MQVKLKISEKISNSLCKFLTVFPVMHVLKNIKLILVFVKIECWLTGIFNCFLKSY